MFNAFDGSERAGTMLLLGAAVLIYAVARSAVDLLTPEMTSPGRLAIAQVAPVAGVAWVAAIMGEPALVLAAVFGTSIAALTVVMGVVLAGASPLQLPASARAWQFVLPIAILMLLMGFAGRLGLEEAAILVAMGGAVAGVWNANETLPTVLAADAEVATVAVPRSPDRLRFLQATLTILLAAVAGWLAVRGSVDLAATRRGLSPGVIGLTLLSAMLILPQIGVATLLGQTGRVGVAAGAQVGTALITLTFILPVAIVLWYASGLTRLSTAVELGLPTEGVGPTPLPFAVGFWRIEGSLLIAASLPMLPVALGRWRPARLEGAALIFAYLFYLLVITKEGSRWH